MQEREKAESRIGIEEDLLFFCLFFRNVERNPLLVPVFPSHRYVSWAHCWQSEVSDQGEEHGTGDFFWS